MQLKSQYAIQCDFVKYLINMIVDFSTREGIKLSGVEIALINATIFDLVFAFTNVNKGLNQNSQAHIDECVKSNLAEAVAMKDERDFIESFITMLKIDEYRAKVIIRDM